MPLINGQTSTRGELPGLSSHRWGSLQRRQRKTKLRLQRQDRREHPRCLQCLLLRNSRIRRQHASRTYVERSEARGQLTRALRGHSEPARRAAPLGKPRSLVANSPPLSRPLPLTTFISFSVVQSFGEVFQCGYGSLTSYGHSFASE